MHNFENTDRWNDFLGHQRENKIYELRDDVAAKAKQLQNDPDFSEKFALVYPGKTVDEYAFDVRYQSRKLPVPVQSWGEEIALSLLVNIIQRPINFFQTTDDDSNGIKFRYICTFETADVGFNILPPVNLLRDKSGIHYDLLRDSVQPGRGESSSGFMAGLLEEFKDTARHLEKVERRERREEKRAKKQKKIELVNVSQELVANRNSMLAERVLALLAAANEDEDPGPLLDLLGRCGG
jgi:hypothetical protein